MVIDTNKILAWLTDRVLPWFKDEKGKVRKGRVALAIGGLLLLVALIFGIPKAG